MPNFAKLREAWTYLSAIPDSAFSMDVWFKPEDCNCGTIACAVGWLLSDPQGKFAVPDFVLQSVHDGETYSVPLHHGERWVENDHAGYWYTAKLFDLDIKQAQALFQAITDWEEDFFKGHKQMSDKQIFHIRLNAFFAKHGETL